MVNCTGTWGAEYEANAIFHDGSRIFDHNVALTTVTVLAYSVPQPLIDLSESTHDFGQIGVGRSSDPWTFYVNNTGLANLVVTDVAVDPGFTNDFSVNITSFTVAPDDSQAVEVVFNPTSESVYQNVEMDITSNDPAQGTVTVTLNGEGIIQPEITISPENMNFGYVQVNSTSQQDLIITNTGASDLTVYPLTIGTGDVFTFVNLETPLVLEPDDTLTVAISFTPTAETAYADTIYISSDDPAPGRDLVNVPLLGIGANPPTVNIVFPGVDEIMNDDSTYTTSWTISSVTDISYVVIDYSLDNGAHWTEIDFLNGVGNDGPATVDWHTPSDTYSSTGLFRVIARNLAAYSDTAEVHISVGPFDSSNNFGQGWSMVGLPLTMDSYHVNDVFNELTGPFFVYDYTASDGYSRVETMELGRGYWIAVSNNSTENAGGTPVVETQTGDLDYDWNLIGVDFPVYYDLDDLRFTDGADTTDLAGAHANGWTDESIFTYEANSYVEVDSLAPWGGYWLLVYANGISVIADPPEYHSTGGGGGDDGGGNPFRGGAGSELDADDSWRLSVSLSLGEMHNDLIRFGVDPEATDSYDLALDAPMPPSPPEGSDYLLAYFNHDEWADAGFKRFRRELNAPIPVGESKQWMLTVDASESGELQVHFLGVSRLIPENYRIECIVDGFKYDISSQEIITFQLDETKDLTIIVYHETSAAGEDDSSIPEEFSISDPYPNPFNPSVSLDLSLPETSEVTMNIYDIQGRLIDQAEVSTFAAGYHSLRWNAFGHASGLYLVEISAGSSFHQVRKAMLIK